MLDLVACGMGNQEIARRLSISHRTARNHVSNIFTKPNLGERVQAVVAARDAGLGSRSGRRSPSSSVCTPGLGGQHP